MPYRTITYELDDHVAVLTYNRPHQRNAISREMNAELHDAWQRFRDDDDAFALVLTGAGEAFCAGWDLEDAAEWLENALLADIRIAAENAVFGALERRWNIVAGDGMTVRLPLVIGWARAAELIITGRAVGAEEALRIGLANEIVPEGQALDRALELAGEIAGLPQGAIRTDKETLVRNIGRTLEQQLRHEAEATLSMFMRRDSHAIGARAFKEKREPQWPHHGL
jgi:enoyl-CoA hydratase